MIIDTGYCRFKIAALPKFALKEANKIYSNTDVDSDYDFAIELKTRSPIRRFISKQLDFYVDDFMPFRPVPYKEAYAFLEWSMNWAITALISTDFMLHAAVLEKNGKAVIFPAPPGSGKSTLTAYLMLNGWRLLSDEMTIICSKSGDVFPSVRPICLKNNSIDIVRDWDPSLIMTTPIKDTNKGTISHVKPTRESYEQRHVKAKPVGIFYPQYKRDSALNLFELSKSDSFTHVVKNAFNFSVLGNTGFDAATKLVESCWHISGEYSDLAEVKMFLEEQL